MSEIDVLISKLQTAAGAVHSFDPLVIKAFLQDAIIQLTAATQAREQAERVANDAMRDANAIREHAIKQIDSLTTANAGLVEENKRLKENAGLDAERWLMVELIRKKEGVSVEIVYDNPDFGGPNSLVIVRDCLADSEMRYTGEDITDALKKALAAQRGGG